LRRCLTTAAETPETRRDILGALAFLAVQLGECLILIGGVHVAADGRGNFMPWPPAQILLIVSRRRDGGLSSHPLRVKMRPRCGSEHDGF